jgi:hypothetical protein
MSVIGMPSFLMAQNQSQLRAATRLHPFPSFHISDGSSSNTQHTHFAIEKDLPSLDSSNDDVMKASGRDHLFEISVA